MMSRYADKLYHFEMNFDPEPRRYSFIHLYQFGELYGRPDCTIPLHENYVAEISYIISGSASFSVAGREYEVCEGDFIVVCPGESHYICADRRDHFRMFFIGFLIGPNETEQADEGLDLLRQFYAKPPASAVCRNGLSDTGVLMSRLNKEFYIGGTLSDIAIDGLLKQILIDVYRSYSRQSVRYVSFFKEENMLVGPLYNATHYIDIHCLEINGVRDVASVLGYSMSHLSHLFQENLGITVQDYLIQKRMERGIQAIIDGKLSLTQIAEMLHYRSLQAFSRAFKRVVGLSPSQFLRENQLAPVGKMDSKYRVLPRGASEL